MPSLPLAEINQLWYSLPLIVAISLVYSATRHEAIRTIVAHSVRLGVMIAGFMAVIWGVLEGLALWL